MTLNQQNGCFLDHIK